ncbi:MAG: hypothetical protein ACJ761_06580, partial [Chloroflexota bacterium]
MAQGPSHPEESEPSPSDPGTSPIRRFRDPDTIIDRLVVPAALFVLAWLVYAWINNGRPSNLDYFVPLADAFLHGRVGLTEAPSYLNELVPAGNGLFYVVYPPAPAVLLLPIVAIVGPSFEQAWASILLGAANVAIASIVIRWMGVARWPRVVLSLVFGFGTIVWYSAQAGSSWHFAHVVATCFMLLAINACQRDARPGLVGLLFGIAVLARLPLLLAAPFFGAYVIDRSMRERSGDWTPFGSLLGRPPLVWRTRIDLPSLFDHGRLVVVGTAIPILAYLVYDQVRFGSPLENGYSLIPGLLQEDQYRNGFFSVVNIPRKLY